MQATHCTGLQAPLTATWVQTRHLKTLLEELLPLLCEILSRLWLPVLPLTCLVTCSAVISGSILPLSLWRMCCSAISLHLLVPFSLQLSSSCHWQNLLSSWRIHCWKALNSLPAMDQTLYTHHFNIHRES